MLLELFLLVLIAAGVFAFVLAPLVLPERTSAEVQHPEPEEPPQAEPVAAEQHTVHEPS